VTLRPPAGLAWPLLAALLLRLAALALAPHVPVLGDSQGYVFLARGLRDAGEFMDLAGGVRPPLYPALVALGLDGDDGGAAAFPGVYLLQIAADLAALLVLATLARRAWGPRAAQLTAWAHALFPSAALYAGCVIMAEPVALLAARWRSSASTPWIAPCPARPAAGWPAPPAWGWRWRPGCWSRSWAR